VTGGVSGVEVSRFVIEKSPVSGSAAAGIQVDNGASLRTARNNLIRRIDGLGIAVFGSAPDISYNTIQEYGFHGMFVSGPGSSATMSFNTLVGQPSAQTGIAILNGAKGSAIGNRIVGNGSLSGIALSAPATSGVQIKGNQVFDNARGILVQSTTGALVASNRASRNLQEGILALNSSGNTFDRNDARSNGGTDCSDNSMGSGTGGTANTWTFNRGIESLPPGICTP
jgi:parallel beta-helix repeat protein